jgi:hypothetical protein
MKLFASTDRVPVTLPTHRPSKRKRGPTMIRQLVFRFGLFLCDWAMLRHMRGSKTAPPPE